MHFWLRRGLAALITALVLCGIGVQAAAALTPTQPPGAGQLGAAGPCAAGRSLYQINTQSQGAGQGVWVFTPDGSGTPRTGGRCDDAKRPVAVVVHGYSGILPAIYQGLIDNMVSNGFVVVFANYSLVWAPSVTYPNVLSGLKQAATSMNSALGNRMDMSRIGIWGHSSGAGMVPWLAQQVGSLGWGRNAMWLSMNGMYFAFQVGTSGPIRLPANARVQVVAYDQDHNADQGIGIDAFHSFDIPADHKQHIQLISDPVSGTIADHFTPVSWMGVPLPVNALDWYGVYRNYQALADCSLSGTDCNADLSYMGTRANGTPATPAIVSADPVDMGPATPDRCNYFPSWRLFGVPHLCANP